MEFKHISVLLNEAVDGLNINPDGVYVDGTLGGGGHSYEILSKLSQNGRLIGIDRDMEAIDAASKRLSMFCNVSYVHSNYNEIKNILHDIHIDKIDGALIDLGVSSYQLDCAERGFSYMEDAPLDMRMDKETAFSAYDVINDYSPEELTRIFYEYGEERFSKRIAELICESRKKAPICTTLELVEIIKKAIPERFRQKGSHPAKRIFQAVRIEVNSELEPLRQALEDFFESLAPGGRLCVITFHSLEDRIVKQTFASFAKGCTCPKDFPICVCGNTPKAKIITSKPILPSAEEIAYNKRSKSAKLRICEKM
ncbi:MAG: 16S rRNA (cytosine(1402)-N(4))-methyltransferase RsmH [Clostridia bacterium]|nr:16S rRNA (cytosine(1402)-N(4))-methyltransferase RsmH [Clostridia bacterium]